MAEDFDQLAGKAAAYDEIATRLDEAHAYCQTFLMADAWGRNVWHAIFDDAVKLRREVCICAAIKMPDNYVVRGHRHIDCFRTISGIPRYEIPGRMVQGFVTSTNRFVDRREGAALQIAAGVISACPDLPYLNGELYSEDLY